MCFLVLHPNIALKYVYLLTECAILKTEREPQGGEKASVELDGKYKRLRRLGAKLAHKAQWHK